MDKVNLHFFVGENIYALEMELKRWKTHFSEKHGPENLLTIKGKESSVSDILDAVATMPFIAEKRLVIIEGVPKIEKEDFPSILKNIHPQTVVVIVDAKPDKRLGIVKEIEKAAELKRFDSLSPAELSQWIRSLVQKLGVSIAPDAQKLLLSIVGDDQWTLLSELQKIAAYADGEIRREHVEMLAVSSGSQVIWRLTDLVGSKKSGEALEFLRYRLERGEDAYGMWSILLNMIMNLGLVSAAVQTGLRDERSLTSATGLHPFAIRGLLPLARSLDEPKLKQLIDWAAAADIQLKTGGYHYSAEHPHEVIALTERMILMCG